ncbi:retrotransposon protein, putative, ty1-copia subclass [Tanacetum coccineum]
MDGKVHTYKARLVAKGYTQTHKIDYEETFSPVAKIKSIRIMLAIAVFHDYEIWQMDVKTAFFNEKLTKDVFMAQPEATLAIRGYPIGGRDVHTIQWSKIDGNEAVWIERPGLKMREHLKGLEASSSHYN